MTLIEVVGHWSTSLFHSTTYIPTHLTVESKPSAPSQNCIHCLDPPVGAGGGLEAMLSLAMAGEGGAGMLPAGPRAAAADITPPLAPADLLRPLFLAGKFILTLMVSPCFRARSSFSGGASFSCSIFSSTFVTIVSREPSYWWY